MQRLPSLLLRAQTDLDESVCLVETQGAQHHEESSFKLRRVAHLIPPSAARVAYHPLMIAEASFVVSNFFFGDSCDPERG